MSQQDKPRVWTLFSSYSTDHDAMKWYVSKKSEIISPEVETSQYVDVIELTAYEALQAENEKLRSELEALKKDHATVLKYGVEGQREINRKLTVEITAEREVAAKLVKIAKSISPHSETCAWDNNCECRN
ncbi:MAG TPA: hypothetical protein V6C58_20360, partial [Allocoleopsis sp.]